MPKTGDLKVWWIPQVPMNAFEVPVKNEREADLILNALARYDTFQFKYHIKPNYSNAGGLQIWEDGEWIDWYKELDSGMYWDDFDEYAREVLHVS